MSEHHSGRARHSQGMGQNARNFAGICRNSASESEISRLKFSGSASASSTEELPECLRAPSFTSRRVIFTQRPRGTVVAILV